MSSWHLRVTSSGADGFLTRSGRVLEGVGRDPTRWCVDLLMLCRKMGTSGPLTLIRFLREPLKVKNHLHKPCENAPLGAFCENSHGRLHHCRRAGGSAVQRHGRPGLQFPCYQPRDLVQGLAHSSLSLLTCEMGGKGTFTFRFCVKWSDVGGKAIETSRCYAKSRHLRRRFFLSLRPC